MSRGPPLYPLLRRTSVDHHIYISNFYVNNNYKMHKETLKIV